MDARARTYPPLGYWLFCGLALPLLGMALLVGALFARVPYGLAVPAVSALGIVAIVQLPAMRRLHEGRGWSIVVGVALATAAAAVEGVVLRFVALIPSAAPTASPTRAGACAARPR